MLKPLQASFASLLVLEGARGCWWGEKHHCTFCGLNGSLMKFRSKPPKVLWGRCAAPSNATRRSTSS